EFLIRNDMITIDNFTSVQNAQAVMENIKVLQNSLSVDFFDGDVMEELDKQLEKTYDELWYAVESFQKKNLLVSYEKKIEFETSKGRFLFLDMPEDIISITYSDYGTWVRYYGDKKYTPYLDVKTKVKLINYLKQITEEQASEIVDKHRF